MPNFSLHCAHFEDLKIFYLSLAEGLSGNASIEALFDSREFCQEFDQTAYASAFFRDQILNHIYLITLLANDKNLKIFGNEAFFHQLFNSHGISEKDHHFEQEEFDKALRIIRNQTQLIFVWLHVKSRRDIKSLMQGISEFADLCLQQVNSYYYSLLQKIYGTPKCKRGKPQCLAILGMGKLGGRELNLSSDIDLIFCYPQKGETDSEEKSISNQEFFILLGKHIIRSIGKTTMQGFVFRVDMRLRPYGESGALVSSFDALENYYEAQGRDWERFALVKSRIVDSENSEQENLRLTEILRSFSFRKYTDFSIIESLRNLKQQIRKEVKRRKLENNIKLGSGGIREVEFIVQAIQLIHGGKIPSLQIASFYQAIEICCEQNLLPAEQKESLEQSYSLLRRYEHALQGMQDAQTQELPTELSATHPMLSFLNLDLETFHEQLSAARENIKTEFELFFAEQKEITQDDASAWQAIWHVYQQADNTFEDIQRQLPADIEELLTENESDTLHQFLKTLASSIELLSLSKEARARLDTFIAAVLQCIFGDNDTFQENSDTRSQTLERLQTLVLAVLRRSAYLVLLNENHYALKQLVQLAAKSAWIPEQLARHPALFDELLENGNLYHLPTKEELQDDLRRSLLRIDPDDIELVMEALRDFKNTHQLRVAACEATGVLPLMKVSDYLTYIAETIMASISDIAWRQCVTQYGTPMEPNGLEPGLLTVGFGKLGGLEMSYTSDLDLVFIHNASAQGTTVDPEEGRKPIDNFTFFARLGQKIIHLLNARLSSGKLYETDMRLRPSGNSGLLVTSIKAFEKYQQESAWTWEHQALIRARPVTGSAELTTLFNNVRQSVLTHARDAASLRKDILEMREKMRTHLWDQAASGFDLKQAPGGIVDIEFMVQYAVLNYAQKAPHIVQYTDNVRLLDELARIDFLTSDQSGSLQAAYIALRTAAHACALQQTHHVLETTSIAFKELEPHTIFVKTLWENIFQ